MVRTPQQFKEMQDIEVKTEHRVTRIDPKGKRIEVLNLAQSETQWVSYDKLIIASKRIYDLASKNDDFISNIVHYLEVL